MLTFMPAGDSGTLELGIFFAEDAALTKKSFDVSLSVGGYFRAARHRNGVALYLIECERAGCGRVQTHIFERFTRLAVKRSGLIGLRKLAGYALRSLTIEATGLFSRAYGAFFTVALLPFAGAAVDVDNPAGLLVSKGFRQNVVGLESLSVKNVA